jgi:lysophospholipase L1-like esterase
MKNILAILFGLFLAFCLMEVVLRIYNPFEFRVKGDNIVLTKNKKAVIENTEIPGLDSTIIHQKNKLGFRGEDPPGNLEDFTSIVTVGGSTTECYYVGEGKAWPAQLNKKLQSRFDNIWLNNAGLDGHSTFGHRILIESYLKDLRPTYILFLVGINDVGRTDLGSYDQNLSRRDKPSSKLKSIFVSFAEISETASMALNIYRSLKARRHALFHKLIELQKLPQMTLSDEQRQRVLSSHGPTLDAYASRLTNLAELCKKNGISPIFVTQPALYGNSVDSETGVDLSLMQVDEEHNGALKWEILERYNDITRAVASKTNTLLIDLSRMMPKDSRYYYDFVHFNNEGCSRVATIIESVLSEKLLSE